VASFRHFASEKEYSVANKFPVFLKNNSSENEFFYFKIVDNFTFAYNSFKIFCFRILNIAKFG
jgi:hypothetical protein